MGKKSQIFFTLLILWGNLVYAQIRPNTSSFPGSNTGFPTTGSGFPGDNSGFSVDSLGTDSAAAERKPVKPDTKVIERELMFTHKSLYSFRETRPFERSYYWDKLDHTTGFVQSLGQIGKPYQVFSHGFNENLYDLPFWKNPVMGAYNRYALNPETQVKYFDTRTPYVNVDYLQGPAELQLIGVTVSQNITPFWNSSIFFNRIQSVGVYRNNVTDHSNMYFSSNYRTKNNKYQIFGNITYNKLANEMNGGTPRRGIDNYPVVEGIIYEVPTLYNSAFFKGLSAPNLSGAQSENKITTFYLDHYYHLIGDNDSVKRHNKLTFRNTVTQEFMKFRFVNENISSSRSTNIIPIYPSVPIDSVDVYEGYKTDRFQIAGEASYSLEVGKGYGLNIHGGVRYQTLGFIKDTAIVRENATTQYVFGELILPLITLRGNLSQRLSDVFSAERILSLSGTLSPIPDRPVYRAKGKAETDSTTVSTTPVQNSPEEKETAPERRSPLTLNFQYDVRDLNPSLFQTWFTGDSGNAYRPNPELTNQTLMHIEAKARYQFPTPVRRNDTLLANYVSVTGFYSQASRFIYYSPRLQPLQAGEGEGLNWIGGEVAFRFRFLRKLHIESYTGVQQGSTSSDNDFLKWYARGIPLVYGKSSLYYESRKISFAQSVRIGVDVYYNTNYVGQSVDPLSGAFFPVNYRVPGYARVDAFAAMKIKGVYVFVKFVHANEGLLLAGYYTTPFYPMLERTFTLGVYWSFFD
ncbi:MAG: putative porin [Bacteroidia bacterium]|nr:putative porin [Bacteroidia bacterium]